jgi:hypothetical protein
MRPLALLADPQWQPYVVFPGEFVQPPQRVVHTLPVPRPRFVPGQERRPLFILLDATWPEARKMFRKSPYLDRFPVLSLHPDQVSRTACAAPSAKTILHQRGGRPVPGADGRCGRPARGRALESYLALFTEHYLRARASSRCRQTVPRTVVCRTPSHPAVRLKNKNDSGECLCSLGLASFCSIVDGTSIAPARVRRLSRGGMGQGQRASTNLLLRSGCGRPHTRGVRRKASGRRGGGQDPGRMSIEPRPRAVMAIGFR